LLKVRNVEQIVKTALRGRFPKIHVLSVNVSDDMDDDGDIVLQIKVVFEAANGDLDPTEIPTFVREIMPLLSEAKQPGFPVVTFIAKSDLGKLKPEAA